MQTSPRPDPASSSTNVAANACVGFWSAMDAVTCLHGFSQDGSSWTELVSIGPGDRRWLTPNIRATSLGGAEAELLDLWQREGVRQSHLLGYSQGGRIALWIASRHPTRLLTLATIGAHAGLEGGERRRRQEADRALADRIEREGIGWFASYWPSLPIFAGLARRGATLNERLDAARRRNDPSHLAAQLRGLGAGVVEPFWDQLASITVPSLLIAGEDDHRYVAFARRLHACIPNSEVALIPSAGHAPHLEQPAAVAALLAAKWTVRAGSPQPTAGPTRAPSERPA